MKLACRNLPELREELRLALQSGMAKHEMLVYRMRDGRAKLFSLVGFVHRYRDEEPGMCEELQERYAEEIRTPRDMLCVCVAPDGLKYEIGLLDQPKRRIVSLGEKHRAPRNPLH